MKPTFLRFVRSRHTISFSMLCADKGDVYTADTGKVRVLIASQYTTRMFRDPFVEYTVTINGVRLSDRHQTPHDAARAALWFINRNLPWSVDGFEFKEAVR